MFNTIKNKVDANPKLKNWAHWLLVPKNEYRPRWWVRWFLNPIRHHRGKGALVKRRARLDTMPYNNFSLGANSVVEDFAVINNAVGDVSIGDRTLVGLSNVIIGPVKIGDDVLLAQNVVIAAYNHEYRDINKPISMQKGTLKEVHIADEVWVGANAVITAGVTIGKHAVVAAGSVVTKDVEPYTIVVGNPAKPIKKYDFTLGEWVRVERARIG